MSFKKLSIPPPLIIFSKAISRVARSTIGARTKARHLHNGIAGNTSIRFGRPNSASNRY